MRKVIILFAVSLALGACGPSGDASRPQAKYTAVNEAYSLLNHGETSRAIVLLESVLRKEPDNAEARFILASAYMGKAGVNVFSLHDAFQDVLFSKSLSQVFFSKPTAPAPVATQAPPTPDALGGASLPANKAASNDTAVERLFQDIDEFLNNLRRVSVVFNRFPRVHEAQWPLMEQSLSNLDQLPLEPQVRIYRMFVRLIYFKEVVMTKIVRDPSFGTRQWACSLELGDFQRSLSWLASNMEQVSADFAVVYPKQASPFARAQVVFKLMSDEIGALQTDAPIGIETAADRSQRKLREELRCGSLPSS